MAANCVQFRQEFGYARGAEGPPRIPYFQFVTERN
jgi:hypothetical protein